MLHPPIGIHEASCRISAAWPGTVHLESRRARRDREYAPYQPAPATSLSSGSVAYLARAYLSQRATAVEERLLKALRLPPEGIKRGTRESHAGRQCSVAAGACA